MKSLREIVEGFFFACTAPTDWPWALHGFGGGDQGYEQRTWPSMVVDDRQSKAMRHSARFQRQGNFVDDGYRPG
jgi:hypothetical protein